MILVANILWFLFGGGMVAFLGWVLTGVLLCCTVIGIPFGIAAFRISLFAAFPFGRELVDARVLGEKRIPGTTLANILWIVLAGLWLSILHIMIAVTCFLSFFLVLPIFAGLVHLKLAMVCFAPLGKRAIDRT